MNRIVPQVSDLNSCQLKHERDSDLHGWETKGSKDTVSTVCCLYSTLLLYPAPGNVVQLPLGEKPLKEPVRTLLGFNPLKNRQTQIHSGPKKKLG